jgi:hypothetical protein
VDLGPRTGTAGFGSHKPMPRKPRGKIHHKAFGTPQKSSEKSFNWGAKSTQDIGTPNPGSILPDPDNRYNKKGHRVNNLTSSEQESPRPNPSTLHPDPDPAHPDPDPTHPSPLEDRNLQESTIPDPSNVQKGVTQKPPTHTLKLHNLSKENQAKLKKYILYKTDVQATKKPTL